MKMLLPSQIPTNEELTYRILSYLALLQRSAIECLFSNIIQETNQQRAEQAVALDQNGRNSGGKEIISFPPISDSVVLV